MTSFLSVILVADVGLLVALIGWPWLFAAVVAVVMRLGLAGAVSDRDVGEVVDAAVGRGMPDRFARWLLSRPGGGRGGRMSARWRRRGRRHVRDMAQGR